jgi:hypothetical protein
MHDVTHFGERFIDEWLAGSINEFAHPFRLAIGDRTDERPCLLVDPPEVVSE